MVVADGSQTKGKIGDCEAVVGSARSVIEYSRMVAVNECAVGPREEVVEEIKEDGG